MGRHAVPDMVAVESFGLVTVDGSSEGRVDRSGSPHATIVRLLPEAVIARQPVFVCFERDPGKCFEWVDLDTVDWDQLPFIWSVRVGEVDE